MDTINVKQKLSFKQISTFLEFSEDSIKKLNPSYIHDIIPGKNKNALKLPEDIADKFIKREKELYEFSKAEFNKKEKASRSRGSLLLLVKKKDDSSRFITLNY